MTENELLDRRIEQLVVDTVKRELRKLPTGIRFEDTSDETLSQHIRVVQETGESIAGLTESVLLESLRRANALAGEYARDLSKLGREHKELKSRCETHANAMQRKNGRIDQLMRDCSRIIDERDAAKRKADTMQADLDSARADASRWYQAYNELAKATA